MQLTHPLCGIQAYWYRMPRRCYLTPRGFILILCHWTSTVNRFYLQLAHQPWKRRLVNKTYGTQSLRWITGVFKDIEVKLCVKRLISNWDINHAFCNSGIYHINVWTMSNAHFGLVWFMEYCIIHHEIWSLYIHYMWQMISWKQVLSKYTQ